MIRKLIKSNTFISVTIILQILSFAGSEILAKDPVYYTGENKKSNSDYKDGYHDGQLRPAIGVQNYQIMRANRSHPEWSDGLGWTYNHAPMLAWWKGKFYCSYLNTPMGEHIPPGMTMLVTSQDGKNWQLPKVLFPIYPLHDEQALIRYPFMHQRMGFYMAPNGRFLALAYYGANNGYGIGRVVREISEDGQFGPIYFIRPNDNWNGDLAYPLFTESVDTGFVAACKSLLADKIRRIQWWEEDYLAADATEFYGLPLLPDGDETEPGKAFSFYTREDEIVVGLFKSQWVTLSHDQGETWTTPVKCRTLTYRGAKIWGQRLDDGKYALVYNPTDGLERHPLSIATGNNGIEFDNLVNIHSEVPPKRYWGREKRPGPQYVRGIVEGNGNPPGDDLWVVYSMSKEDIWISRIPVPVHWSEKSAIADDFSDLTTGGLISGWNIYSPRWCPVEVVDFQDRHNKCMMLKDVDPYDYARAVRVFHSVSEQNISFELFIDENSNIFDIEVVAAKGERLVQSRIDSSGKFLIKNGNSVYLEKYKLSENNWYFFEFDLNSTQDEFNISINGKVIGSKCRFSAAGSYPERIIFRTGEYRLQDDVTEYKSGDEKVPGWDEPNADEPVSATIVYIKNFKTKY